MGWITPIYDRTIEDVTYLKDLAARISSLGWDNLSQSEKNTWLTGDSQGVIRGALNHTDLNRIQNNISYLTAELNAIGYPFAMDGSNPTWTLVDLPFLSNINRIRDNIVGLMDSWYRKLDTPVIDYSNPINFDDINDIEKNLADAYYILQLYYSKRENHCGTFKCSQSLIL